ncbi:MAG: PD-(D/E)XK nuclease domain-containing protein [Desulfatirhabdiaceae bacterium]
MSSPGRLHGDNIDPVCGYDAAICKRPESINPVRGYWNEYVSQLPETVFQQVNENFYRTAFYELCSRNLSPWSTWNLERFCLKGRSDLEFVGKDNEFLAGIRMVIEFKYYSRIGCGTTPEPAVFVHLCLCPFSIRQAKQPSNLTYPSFR